MDTAMKLDMHCHTKEGSPDGKTALLDIITTLKQKGYHGMLIADHNSYRAYRYYRKLEKKPQDFTVLCGIEYDTLDAGHILVIMPAGVYLKLLELRGLPVLFLIEIVHRYGGILGPAHPCGEKFLSTFNTRRGRVLKEKLIQKFDFIETFNACEDDISNDCARALARKYHLPEFGGSDSHKADCIGLGYTLLQEQIRDESDLIRYIKEKKSAVSGGAHYYHTTKQKLGRANDILVYSFWFYNKFLAALRQHARNLELARNQLLQPVSRPESKYITLAQREI